MAKKTLINDIYFNEFAFDVIFHASQKDRERLSIKELREIRTNKAAKNFVSKATVDEKLIMLTKLGCKYSFIISGVKNIYPAQIRKLYKQKRQELTEETITGILETGMFIVTDKNIAAFLNLFGNACHSDTYFLNRDFYKAGTDIKEWQSLSEPTTENIRAGIQHVKEINKMLLNYMLQLKHINATTKVNDLDFFILVYLFDSGNNYVEREVIDIYFKPNYRVAQLTAALKRLNESAHIEKNYFSYKKPSYSITSLGIDTVMAFHRKTLNDTFNY